MNRMTRMNEDDLNDLTLSTAAAIEQKTGGELDTNDRYDLNDVLTAWLTSHGVEILDPLDSDPS